MAVYFVTMTITSVWNLERMTPITWAGEIVCNEDAPFKVDAPSAMHRMYTNAFDLTKSSWRQCIGDPADGFVVDNYTVLRCAD